MTRRVFLLCVGLVVITAGFFLLQKLNAPTDAEVLQAEQEIYALLLAIQRNNNSDTTIDIQLVEFTNSGEFKLGLPEGGVGIFQGELELKYFPNLEKKTLLDFQNKNSASHPIMKYLPDSKNVILVNPSSGKQLF